jgi:hypothetical protein
MRRYLASLIVLGVLLVGGSGRALAAPRTVPQNGYACGGSVLVFWITSHCYGTIDQDIWNNHIISLYGAQSSVDVVPLWVVSPLGTPGGSINNEIWITDSQEPAGTCQDSPFHNSPCWIEVGYVYYSGIWALHFTPYEHLFWADVRPSGRGCSSTCGYNEHEGPRLSASTYGKKAVLSIQRLSTTSLTWSVQAVVVGGGPSLYGQSTANGMTPTDVLEGQELAGLGVSGVTATAPKALFDYNAYQSSPLGSWNYFTYNAPPQGNNPPWIGWNNNLTPSLYGHGGELYTCTKLSSGRNPC